MKEISELVEFYFTPEMNEFYRPECNEGVLALRDPAIIHIMYDDNFRIYESLEGLEIENERVLVTLGKKESRMYIFIK